MSTSTDGHKLATHKETAESVHVSRMHKAYRQLQELIVLGRLAPGTRIIESDLASRLGVSRTPVRDALRLLQQEGFVVPGSPAGIKSRLMVAPLTKEDAEDLYGIVGRIEGLAAHRTALLAPNVRAEIGQRLRSLNDGLREMADTGQRDPSRILNLDMDFHRTVVEASAGPRLLAIHNSIKPQTERYWRVYANIHEQLDKSVFEHDQIIQGIEGGNPEMAERSIAQNWQHGWERLCRMIDALGERGSW